MTPALDAVRREELRKLAEAAMHMPGPWDAGEGASFVLSFRDIDAGNDWPLRCVAYIAAMSPDTTLALLARIAELEAGPNEAIATAIAHLEEIGAVPTHDTYDDRRRLMLGRAKALYALRDAAALLPKASVREERR